MKITLSLIHESRHGNQYTQMGKDWYDSFVIAEIDKTLKHFGTEYNPYGKGDDNGSPIIALAEAWGYHMRYLLTGQRYGTNAS